MTNEIKKSAFDNKSVYIFDMDGTITDTEPLHLESYNRTLKMLCGVEMNHDEFLENYVGHSETDIYQLMRKNKKIDFNDAEFFSVRIENLFQIVKERQLSTSLFFQQLCRIYPEKKFVMLTSQRESVLERFRKCVDFGHISEFIAVSAKPYEKKDIICNTEKYLGCSASHAVIFEDYSVTLRIAKNNGVMAIGIQHSLNRLSPDDCDFIIDINKEIDFK